MTALLQVSNLRVTFPGPRGPVHPVDGVSFRLEAGELLALVGESGSGKSLTSLALLGLVPGAGRIAPESAIRLGELDLLTLDPEALRRVRGRRIGLVLQDAMTSLNPVLTLGDQLIETLRVHLPLSAAQARERAAALLAEVGLPDPAGQLARYPHQLSGGMRQRVLIALALAPEPEILIADEPTSALDVTVQAQVLALLDGLRSGRKMALLLITHDLGIVAHRADRVAVMYAGQIVETATARELFQAPQHPYTVGLLASLPRLRGPMQSVHPIPGTVPGPDSWPSGCRFRPRCVRAFARCDQPPPLVVSGGERTSRCWLAEPSA